MRTALIICTILVSTLPACLGDQTGPTTSQGDIRNVWWSLTGFDPVAGEHITLASGENYLLFFGDTTLSGETDSLCRNTYYAACFLGKGDSMSIGPIITTKVYCRSSYSEYLQALGNATSFVLQDKKLTVFYSGGTKKLEFVKQ